MVHKRYLMHCFFPQHFADDIKRFQIIDLDPQMQTMMNKVMTLVDIIDQLSQLQHIFLIAQLRSPKIIVLVE